MDDLTSFFGGLRADYLHDEAFPLKRFDYHRMWRRWKRWRTWKSRWNLRICQPSRLVWLPLRTIETVGLLSLEFLFIIARVEEHRNHLAWMQKFVLPIKRSILGKQRMWNRPETSCPRTVQIRT